MPAGIVQFDEFELDLGRYELRRGDRVVKLEKSPMQLLILLVENQGQSVGGPLSAALFAYVIEK